MPVSDKHPEYSNNSPAWAIVRDCVEGARKIEKGGAKYLPKPNPSDTSAENTERYNAYRERANYVNFTGFTKDGMLGMVFRRDISTNFTSTLEYIEDDATGGGITFDQMARSITGNLLEAGREGLLVEYPEAAQGLTQAQVQAQNLRASILPYRAEDIINWRTHMVGGVKKLSMVVLREPKKIPTDDGFSFEEKVYHRVLLMKEGMYVQNIYNENDELLAQENGTGDIIPKDANGNTWDEIPFVFVGAQNNDEIVDKAPLYDIAEVNIGHYRNSADYEESSFMVGQPTPYAAGLSQSWVDSVMKDGVLIGSRSFVLLPEGGSAGLLQAAPNTMPREAMQDKEVQMVKIGARIIEDSNTNETREGAKIRFGGQTSKLATVVGNVESALIAALEFVQRFMGGDGESTVEMNREFYDATLDPQMVIAMIQLSDRGFIAKPDFRQVLRSAGVIAADRTDDDIDDDVEQDDPLEGENEFQPVSN